MSSNVSLRSFAEQSLHYFVRPHQEAPTAPLESPAAWLGETWRDAPETWTHVFSAHELDELESALDVLEEADAPARARPETPMPQLAAAAGTWRSTLMAGRGFLRLRGLPVERWPQARAERAFWILGTCLGVPGAQNPQGEHLGHVRDYGEGSDQPNARLYRTAARIGFHCDAADVVGLLCLARAAEGGASRIASSVAIWNALFREDPEAAALLFEPFAVDRRDEQGPDEPPYFEMPPCRFGPDGQLRTFYHGEYFRSVERLPEHGPLSAARRRALDRFDAIGHDPAYRLDMDLEPGDVQLLSNHSVVHARTDYRDDPARPRHLLRLWLSLDAPVT